MNSHWYCKEKDKIILTGMKNNFDWFCFDENSCDFDEMLIQAPPSLTIFMKFESFEYIHSFVSKTGNYVVELPRFNLFFEKEENGKFRSLTFAGLQLCNVQQFDDRTLREFHNYLLLEDAKGKLKMIVPQGKVIKNKSDTGIAIRCF
jgi:hypothetical protein